MEIGSTAYSRSSKEVQVPLDIDMRESPDPVPLLSDRLDSSLNSRGTTRERLVVLLDTLHLNNGQIYILLDGHIVQLFNDNAIGN